MRFIKLNSDNPLYDKAKKYELEYFDSEFVSFNNAYTYLLIDDNEIVGSINIQLIDTNQAEILNFYINKEYRGFGYSKVILNILFKKLKKINVNELYLEVKSNNYIAINLYKSCGFIEIGIRKNYYKDNIDAILMKANIG